ncbi:MAG TPA: CDGSH iron-sulfur domain-containing protein [Propionibacteriaceae bacterium]
MADLAAREGAGQVRDTRAPVITCYPDGPMLVRGDVALQDADGQPIPRRRRTVALCRCGKSGIFPMCDGTHKVIGFKTPC